jgi:hypothetical protein
MRKMFRDIFIAGGDGRIGHLIRQKNGDVFTAGNTEPQRLKFAFFLKIMIEALTKLACVVSDDVVFPGTIPRTPGEDMNSNLILADLVCLSTQCAIANVEQELGQERRFGKAATARDAQSKLPAGIFGEVGAVPRRFSVSAGAVTGTFEEWIRECIRV